MTPLILLLLISLTTAAKNVRVDLFVMSKCPGSLTSISDNITDAYACEVLFQPVIAKVGNIVDLNLNYIAQVDNTQPTGFHCLHGQTEVKENIVK
jgi:hypothetical protein